MRKGVVQHPRSIVVDFLLRLTLSPALRRNKQHGRKKEKPPPGPERMTKREVRHKDVVRVLAQRLRQKSLDVVFEHYTYTTPARKGEADMLAYSRGRWRFYEVKTKHKPHAYRHACEQYWRFCKAYPDIATTGIYVTEECVERLPPYLKYRQGLPMPRHPFRD